MMNREKFLHYNHERNEDVKERYELAIGRIAQIVDDSILEEPYRTYFVKVSKILLSLDALWKIGESNPYSSDWVLKELPDENPYKIVLSNLCHEIIGKSEDVQRGRLDLLTIEAELFLEIYFIFQDEPSVRQVEQAMYWHNSDYAEVFGEDFVERILGIAPSYEEELLWHEKFLQYKEQTVAFVLEQYLSYQDCNDLQGKILPICFEKGLESIAQSLIMQLREKEIQVIVCKFEDLFYNGEQNYIWMNRQYKERRLQVLRTQLQRYKERCEKCLSPLILYHIGIIEEESINQKQNKIWKTYFEEQESVLYSYIPDKTCIVL